MFEATKFLVFPSEVVKLVRCVISGVLSLPAAGRQKTQAGLS